MGDLQRKPGRPRKGVGLAPPTLRQVADGLEVRDVRREAGGQDQQVLPPTRGEAPPSNATVGVFGPAVLPDAGRGGQSGPPKPPLPNAPGGGDGELSLQAILKRLLAETAEPFFQDVTFGREITNAEALARKLLQKALLGNEKAQEMVIDRVEGKAGRAVDAKPLDTTLEDLIDRSGVDALNALLPPQEK